MTSEAVNCAAPDTGNMGKHRSILPLWMLAKATQRSLLGTGPPNSRKNGLHHC